MIFSCFANLASTCCVACQFPTFFFPTVIFPTLDSSSACWAFGSLFHCRRTLWIWNFGSTSRRGQGPVRLWRFLSRVLPMTLRPGRKKTIFQKGNKNTVYIYIYKYTYIYYIYLQNTYSNTYLVYIKMFASPLSAQALYSPWAHWLPPCVHELFPVLPVWPATTSKHGRTLELL